MSELNVSMFLNTGREIALKDNDLDKVIQYNHVMHKAGCDSSIYAIPLDEEGLVDLLRNEEYGSIADDLSKYKSGEMNLCAN